MIAVITILIIVSIFVGFAGWWENRNDDAVLLNFPEPLELESRPEDCAVWDHQQFDLRLMDAGIIDIHAVTVCDDPKCAACRTLIGEQADARIEAYERALDETRTSWQRWNNAMWRGDLDHLSDKELMERKISPQSIRAYREEQCRFTRETLL